jgi:hypothetical protein
MNTRHLLGFLVVCLGTFGLGGAAHAVPCGITSPCPSDLIQFVDFSTGAPINDVHGNPAIIRLPELAVAGEGTNSVSITVPIALPATLIPTIALTEGPAPLTGPAQASDLISPSFVAGPTGGIAMQLTFSSDSELAQTVDCSTADCIEETGQIQNVGLLEVGGGGTPQPWGFQVQSDVEVVPEPETLVLVAAGLSGLGAVGARRQRG